jgi:hypothetical protein
MPIAAHRPFTTGAPTDGVTVFLTDFAFTGAGANETTEATAKIEARAIFLSM